jgi:hypothetical protein
VFFQEFNDEDGLFPLGIVLGVSTPISKGVSWETAERLTEEKMGWVFRAGEQSGVDLFGMPELEFSDLFG